MRLAIFDNSLRTYSGHHFEYARCLVEESRRRGWVTRVYAHRNATADILEKLGAEAVFDRDIYSPPSRFLARFLKGRFYHIAATFVGNVRQFAELRKLKSERRDPSDILFFHTITHREILGILLWYWLYMRRSSTSLVLLLRYQTGRKGRDPRSEPATYRAAFRLIRNTLPRVHIVSDSSLLADLYQSLGAPAVGVLPIPHTPASSTPATMSANTDLKTVIMPGYSSIGKGLAILADAVDVWPEDLSHILLRVQSSDIKAGVPGAVQHCLDRLRRHSRVEILEGSPDTSTFYAWMSAADAVLVIYDPDYYGGQTSGIFSDAAALGKPVITSHPGWMSTQIENGRVAGKRMTDYSSPSLIDALREYLADAPACEAQARSFAEGWRSEHNAATLLNRLEKLHHADQGAEKP